MQKFKCVIIYLSVTTQQTQWTFARANLLQTCCMRTCRLCCGLVTDLLRGNWCNVFLPLVGLVLNTFSVTALPPVIRCHGSDEVTAGSRAQYPVTFVSGQLRCDVSHWWTWHHVDWLTWDFTSMSPPAVYHFTCKHHHHSHHGFSCWHVTWPRDSLSAN